MYTDKVESIINRANDNVCYEEYISSIGYGELWADLKKNLEENVDDKELVEVLLANWKLVKPIITDCLDISEANIYIQSNELISVVIGEVEVDISEDGLTNEELEDLGNEMFIKNGLAYMDRNYDRVVACLDIEKCREMLIEKNILAVIE